LEAAVLGPIDIEDWSDGDEDRLRAEIRLLPIMRRLRMEPRETSAALTKEIKARLRRFDQDPNVPAVELRELLGDLGKIDLVRR
jgi:hypothetical protein